MFRKKGVPTVTLDEGRVLCRTGDVDRLTALGLNTLEGAMSFSDGVIVRHAGNRTTYKVKIEGEVWYVKIHKDVDWKSKFSFFGLLYASNVASPGHREWDATNMLRADGFDVASPVAFGKEKLIEFVLLTCILLPNQFLPDINRFSLSSSKNCMSSKVFT